MKPILPILAALAAAATSLGQPPPRVIPLWPNGAPCFESRKDIPEVAKDYWVKNINNPSLTVFLPPPGKANGCAVIVAPGGGFRELVFKAEGVEPAKYLNSLGVAAFALKYRLPKEDGSPYTDENVRQDGNRAVRLVRSRAAEFGIDPNRIGILGFSKGATVVNLIAYQKSDGDPSSADPVERVSGRPNFEMMIYPGDPSPKVVTPDTGPAFLLCATDDEYRCDQVALDIYEKMRAANVPVEAHFIVRGKHAFNMGQRSPYAAIRGWPQRMADWLSDSGLLRRPAG